MATDYTSFNIALCEWLGLDAGNVAEFLIVATGDDTTITAVIASMPGAPDDPDEVVRELRRFRVCPMGDDDTMVEIGGQRMTQAQFDAARFPLLNPTPGPLEEQPDEAR